MKANRNIKSPSMLTGLECCSDKTQKQRMRTVWPALEFGMKLNADEKRFTGNLYGFYQPSVRG